MQTNIENDRNKKERQQNVFDDSFWNEPNVMIESATKDLVETRGALSSLREIASELKLEPDNEIPIEVNKIQDDIDAGWNNFNATIETTRQEVSERIDTLLIQEHVDFQQLEMLIAISTSDAKKTLHERMSIDMSSVYATKIIESFEYRESLKRIDTHLQGDGSDLSPELLKDRSLRNLVGIKECIGESIADLVRAMNLTQDIEDSTLERGEEILRLSTFSPDATTGLLNIDIDIQLTFNTKNGDMILLGRKVELEHKDAIPHRGVHHAIIAIPNELNAQGLAAKLTHRSLQQYDIASFDAIDLHANVDVGGYAWASYGYGWNKEQMEKNKESVDAILAGVKNVIVEKSTEANVAQDKRILAMLITIDSYIANSDAVTPQMIAVLGKDGPHFHQGDSGRYYTQHDYEIAIQNGTDVPQQNDKGPMHLGKIAMLGTSWHGKIELKPDGEQKGLNRKLLENKLERSLNGTT